MTEDCRVARADMIDYLLQAAGVTGLIVKRRVRRSYAAITDEQLQARYNGVKATAEQADAMMAQVDAQLTQQRREARNARKTTVRLKLEAALAKLDGISAPMRLRRPKITPTNG